MARCAHKGVDTLLIAPFGLCEAKLKSKAKVTPYNIAQMKNNFLADICAVVEMKEVPSAMVLNWDHTDLKCVPISSWTIPKEGSKRVEISGIYRR